MKERTREKNVSFKYYEKKISLRVEYNSWLGIVLEIVINQFFNKSPTQYLNLVYKSLSRSIFPYFKMVIEKFCYLIPKME